MLYFWTFVGCGSHLCYSSSHVYSQSIKELIFENYKLWNKCKLKRKVLFVLFCLILIYFQHINFDIQLQASSRYEGYYPNSRLLGLWIPALYGRLNKFCLNLCFFFKEGGLGKTRILESLFTPTESIKTKQMPKN